MNAASLARFNNLKAAAHRALWPATITFQQTGATQYTATFGEIDNDGQLDERGQGIQNHRIGVLEIAIADYVPGLLQTFTIVAAPSQPQLVGRRYKVGRIVSAPGEPVVKCHATRLET